MIFVENRIIGQIDHKIRVLNVLAGRFWGGSLGRLVAAQYGFYARYQFLGIKWFDNIVVCTELQAEHFVKDFAFG